MGVFLSCAIKTKKIDAKKIKIKNPEEYKNAIEKSKIIGLNHNESLVIMAVIENENEPIKESRRVKKELYKEIKTDNKSRGKRKM